MPSHTKVLAAFAVQDERFALESLLLPRCDFRTDIWSCPCATSKHEAPISECFWRSLWPPAAIFTFYFFRIMNRISFSFFLSFRKNLCFSKVYIRNQRVPVNTVFRLFQLGVTQQTAVHSSRLKWDGRSKLRKIVTMHSKNHRCRPKIETSAVRWKTWVARFRVIQVVQSMMASTVSLQKYFQRMA